jgi:hypothetical protein
MVKPKERGDAWKDAIAFQAMAEGTAKQFLNCGSNGRAMNDV